MRIEKYYLPMSIDKHYFILDLPEGAELLTVESKYCEPIVWAVIDPNKELKKRLFYCSTGELPVKKYKYIGTATDKEEGWTYHYFEVLG